jgi:hypothetical protein
MSYLFARSSLSLFLSLSFSLIFSYSNNPIANRNHPLAPVLVERIFIMTPPLFRNLHTLYRHTKVVCTFWYFGWVIRLRPLCNIFFSVRRQSACLRMLLCQYSVGGVCRAGLPPDSALWIQLCFTQRFSCTHPAVASQVRCQHLSFSLTLSSSWSDKQFHFNSSLIQL